MARTVSKKSNTSKNEGSQRPWRPRAAVVLGLSLGLVLGTGAGAGLGVAAPAPAAAAPFCGQQWGSTPEAAGTYSSARITDLRTGRHGCFDRMVVDLDGAVSGYDVRYVHSIHQEGSGRHVPVAGGARLQVVVRSAAHTESGRPTFDPVRWDRAATVDGFRTFRQVSFTGSFEGQSTFGLGVRARLPFRAFIVNGPGSGSRLIVDVAHRW